MVDRAENERLLRPVDSFLNQREKFRGSRMWSPLTEEQKKDQGEVAMCSVEPGEYKNFSPT
jgi:hypothetical protein